METAKITNYLIPILLIVVIAGIAVYFYLPLGQEREKAGNDLIVVDSPLPGDVVRSPLQVTGKARGNWYFEATFPVKLVDENGKVITEHYGQAQGEWMTTDFVPFIAELTFGGPSSSGKGFLILERSNPSGLPENYDELRIPVKF